MKIICAVLVVVFFSSCYSQKVTITFINQSEVGIDSLRIGISSADVFTLKHVSIGKSDTVITVIPHDKQRSNHHDITIFISIYIKNNKVIYSYSYNDLAGYLSNDYTIILNGKKEIQWH